MFLLAEQLNNKVDALDQRMGARTRNRLIGGNDVLEPLFAGRGGALLKRAQEAAAKAAAQPMQKRQVSCWSPAVFEPPSPSWLQVSERPLTLCVSSRRTLATLWLSTPPAFLHR